MRSFLRHHMGSSSHSGLNDMQGLGSATTGDKLITKPLSKSKISLYLAMQRHRLNVTDRREASSRGTTKERVRKDGER